MREEAIAKLGLLLAAFAFENQDTAHANRPGLAMILVILGAGAASGSRRPEPS